MTKNREKVTGHIPAEKLEKLGNYELTGPELVESLEHLETCAECREKIKKPSVEQLTDRLRTKEAKIEANRTEADLQI